MQCPKCTAGMESDTFHELEVDRCSGCHGLWFDAGELEHLKELKGSEILDPGAATVGKVYNKRDHIFCPRCRVPMQRTADASHPHIHFETCPTCHGCFLDAGEFRDLKHHSFGAFFRKLFGKKKPA